MNDLEDSNGNSLLVKDRETVGAKLIVGERILGLVDPQTLTRKEFESSPELLFHGSSRPFTFSRDFDYHSKEYLSIDEGSSATSGFGFYATDKENASDYSTVRAGLSTGEKQPHITSILPYHARCLDLRLKSNPTENAPIPKDFADKWISYFKDFTENPDRYANVDSHMAPHLKDADADYLKRLKEISEGEITDLKKLLHTHEYPSPYWMYTFANFVLKEGYDGLVINEGSEKSKNKSVTTFVFYNLDKIGTYETWHKEPEATN